MNYKKPLAAIRPNTQFYEEIPSYIDIAASTYRVNPWLLIYRLYNKIPDIYYKLTGLTPALFSTYLSFAIHGDLVVLTTKETVSLRKHFSTINLKPLQHD
jgi:hypothetical protein